MSTDALATLPHTEALWPALWASPLPAMLQDASFRVVDVNEAFVHLLGHSRERVVGTDAVQLQPQEDRELTRGQRDEWRRRADDAGPLPAVRRRMHDAEGRAHWFLLTTLRLAPPGRQVRWLTLLQDETGAHAAREEARRADDELAQWFELSGTGMVVYDSTGLILRSNGAFEALVERVPEVLDGAGAELQAVLGWDAGALSPALQPGARPLERHGVLLMDDGRRKRVSARLVCQAGGPGQRRVLAVLEDRRAEEERDLAQMEVGMLMDAARVGVATFDPARGWLASPASPRTAGAVAELTEGEGTLLGIRRELVEPDSLPDFERLQQALRRREREDVRYAVRHPELGTRWLLTRVAPVQLADGRETMSVVTLDITVQETALRRNEQLLREMETILDSSTAGIAYLRGPVLVRCNRRFERMLGFDPGAAAGASLEEILSRSIGPLDGVREALQALAGGRTFEAELPLVRDEGPVQWYSLSVRRAEAPTDRSEAVAVLTDITRLKAQQAELEQLLRDRELMFSLSEVGIVYQRGARVERANQAMAELTGWSAPELATLDPAELYENARACVDFEARISQALRDHGRFTGERQLRKRDGRLLWVQVAVRPVDPDDAEAGVISSFVDIDERRRARETLAVQAERTRSILNSVLVGIVTVSERGIEWMNRSARRMFAGELADFVGEPISIVATPEPDHPLRRADWLHRLDEGQAETFECRMRGRDGREFWVVGNAVLTGSGSDQASREVTFALLDIERRRQAEVHIAQAQASLQRVIETAPLAIALFDAQSLRVQQLNQNATAFFSRPIEQVLGSAPEDCCPPEQARALRGWLSDVAAGGQRRQHEWDQPGSMDVPRRIWDCRLAPLDDGGNAAAQLLLVATDVTEQRAAELARLQAAIDQREVLVREVHHRIKNNLQGVAGLLQQTAARNPDMSIVLGEAVGQVQAIAQVYGLQVGARGPLAAASLMRGIASSVQRTFGCVIRAEVQGEVPHELPEAESIPFALVLNELLTNAFKHGQSGGELHCQLALADPGIALRVWGVGRLPASFDLANLRPGVAGLGLVRALLPRKSARFTLQQEGEHVVAQVDLWPPAVRLPAEADQRQSGA
jgi:PAS domain S-box-containing protein